MVENFRRLEDSRTEFKEDIPEDSLKYLKTVVAFANCTGGEIYFGVNDDGEIKGLPAEKIARKEEQIINAITDSCEPKITPKAEVLEEDGKKIIRIRITQGMHPPYYIRKLGRKQGIYQRLGNETRVVARDSTFVRELELKGSGFEFDTMQTEGTISLGAINALCARLYRHARQNEHEAKTKRITWRRLVSWGVIKELNGEYFPTNAWWLFTKPSRQFKDYAIIKMAIFKGTNREYFFTQKIAKGPIDIQLEEALAFVLEHINLSSRFVGS